MKNLDFTATMSANPQHICRMIKSKTISISFYSIIVITLISTVGCSPNASNTSTITNSQIEHELQKQRDLADIENNITNSYARIAAKRVDICPKLLQKNIDDSLIERSSEVMVEDHCDYYLYPQVGQRLIVTPNTDEIEALLVVPTLHNFANGEYQVVSYDKHVIRLAYHGMGSKPDRLNYDVTIQVLE